MTQHIIKTNTLVTKLMVSSIFAIFIQLFAMVGGKRDVFKMVKVSHSSQLEIKGNRQLGILSRYD